MRLLTYWWQLARLRRDERQAYKKIDTSAAELDSMPLEKMAAMIDAFMSSRDEITRRIDLLKTERLMQVAERYDLPIPAAFLSVDRDRQELRSPLTYRLLLNETARHELRSAIRTEQRERRERWIWWIPIVFGLIGALTGLVAIAAKL